MGKSSLAIASLNAFNDRTSLLFCQCLLKESLWWTSKLRVKDTSRAECRTDKRRPIPSDFVGNGLTTPQLLFQLEDADEDEVMKYLECSVPSHKWLTPLTPLTVAHTEDRSRLLVCSTTLLYCSTENGYSIVVFYPDLALQPLETSNFECLHGTSLLVIHTWSILVHLSS